MIPSGNVENPGVKGDKGECRVGIMENLLPEVWLSSDKKGDTDGGLAFRGGRI